jgi:hypothetical protein
MLEPNKTLEAIKMLRMFSARTALLAFARMPSATARLSSSGATGGLADSSKLPMVMEPST